MRNATGVPSTVTLTTLEKPMPWMLIGRPPVTDPCAGLRNRHSNGATVSQASPTPSPSASAWDGLGTVGQLSVASGTVSASVSVTSQASPMPLPFVSVWAGLATVGQLSHASPTESPSASAWDGLTTVGQFSHASPKPPPSLSDY